MDVPDFPKKGIIFKDITPLLQDRELFSKTIDLFADRYRSENVDSIVAVESRGFIIGAPLAYRLNAGFIPARKEGKLPREAISEEYSLEYGVAGLEMHKDAILKGQRILIVDDVLATGGTARATVNMVKKLGGDVVGAAFLIELLELEGRIKIADIPVYSMIKC
jgi:adenine phosphoribosyltransferase